MSKKDIVATGVRLLSLTARQVIKESDDIVESVAKTTVQVVQNSTKTGGKSVPKEVVKIVMDKSIDFLKGSRDTIVELVKSACHGHKVRQLSMTKNTVGGIGNTLSLEGQLNNYVKYTNHIQSNKWQYNTVSGNLPKTNLWPNLY